MAPYMYLSVSCFLVSSFTLSESTFLYGLFKSVYTDTFFSGLPRLEILMGRRALVCASRCSRNAPCKGFAYKAATRSCIMYSKCPDVRCDSGSNSQGWHVYCIGGEEPKNCNEIMNKGRICTGVYHIEYAPGLYKDVFCEMNIKGGGWTVFQKRLDGSVNFYRNWADYKAGFGDPGGEYWLGLDALHRLTMQYSSIRLYIRLMDFSNVVKSDIYTNFKVNDESDFYRILFEWSSGNVTKKDGILLCSCRSVGPYTRACTTPHQQEPCLHNTDDKFDHDSMQFSTFDVDKDLDPEAGFSCAQYGQGAWWYNACLSSNLNGLYLGPGVADDHTSNSCKGFSGADYRPLKTVMMMLREEV